MSKDNSKKKRKPIAKEGIKIPYPYILLSLVVLILYSPSINSGFTDLDDKIFIVEQESFIKDISNIGPSYKRGTFSEKNDNYFRPVLLNSFIINYQFSGTEIKGYHVFNILIHAISVMLLYWLFTLIFADRTKVFLLTLLFAIHPVLTQAVAWIPGRNDSLLFVFAAIFLIAAIKYVSNGKPLYILIQFLALLMALFTKETALLIAPAAFIILITHTNFRWNSRAAFLQYTTWLFSGIVWFVVRSNASLQSEPTTLSEIPSNFIERSPLLVQYLGKILLPFNLSVFPMMNDTTYIYGIAALIITVALIVLTKNKNNKRIIGGFSWYFMILVPVLLLPSSINNQDFEHRLYLPLLGILMVLGETIVFDMRKPKQTVVAVVAIALVLSVMNNKHQKKFTDPLTFWTAAYETTPNSYYAAMNMGSRIDEVDYNRSIELLKRSYELNPDGKYINFYMGSIAMKEDSLDLAAKYFKRELELSAYYETYYQFSQVEFMRKDLNSSIIHLEKFLQFVPDHPQAIYNYTLMLLDTDQVGKAMEFVQETRKKGIRVPPELFNKVMSVNKETSAVPN